VSGIVWQTPPSALIAEIEEYGERIKRAVRAVGDFIAPKIQAYAQAHAPWQDQSGNARQGLAAIAEVAEELVTIYLYHGMDYGKWLELKNGGKYAIINKALQAHYGEIMALIASAMRGG
jgi:cellulose synthase/poly-beta-1,6-N-acetylglucosamine synthase-like glycosyltransferase